MNPSPPPNIYIVGAQSTGKTTLVNNLRDYFHSHPHARHTNDNDIHNTSNNNTPPPAIITEVARTVLATHHFTAQDVRIPARSLALQRLILEAQAAAEERALLHLSRSGTTAEEKEPNGNGTAVTEGGSGSGSGSGSGLGSGPGLGSGLESGLGWFISDRSGADPIAYAARYVGGSGGNGGGGSGEEAAETAWKALTGTAAWKALTGTAAWQGLRARMRRSLVVVCKAGMAAAEAGWLRDDGVRLMPRDVEEWVGFHGLFCRLLEAEGVPYVVLGAEVGGSEERVRFVVGEWRECAVRLAAWGGTWEG